LAIAAEVGLAASARLAIFGILDVELGPGWMFLDELVLRSQVCLEEGADILELRWPGPDWDQADRIEELRSLIGRLYDRLAVLIAVRCHTAELADGLIAAGASVLVTQGPVETATVAAVAARTPVKLLGCPDPLSGRSSMADVDVAVEGLVAEMAILAEAARAAGMTGETFFLDPSSLAVPASVLRALPRVLNLEFPVAIEPAILARATADPASQGSWEAEGAVASLAVAAGATVLRVRDVRRLARVGRMADAIVRSVADDPGRATVGA
jgi:dihydropteroate synthase